MFCRVAGVFLLLCMMAACTNHHARSTGAQRGVSAYEAIDASNVKPEAISLLGTPLHAPELSEEIRFQRERDLENAQSIYNRDPHDEESIIWLGRRLAYLGRYRDAIDIFSNGIAIHPDSHKLLRHRGHRYITIRNFDLALADLNRAAELIEVGSVVSPSGIPDEIEPDGQPNAQNIPTSTSHTNIYYHLGLVRYLTGDFSGAADAYRRCMTFSKNDDMRIATMYWQYLTVRRLNDDRSAAEILNAVSHSMNIMENGMYHRLLLMFKGDLTPEDVMKPGDGEDASVDLATVGYGVGMYHMLNGERDAAMKQFRSVIEETNWAAFGHIASEAECSRHHGR